MMKAGGWRDLTLVGVIIGVLNHSSPNGEGIVMVSILEEGFGFFPSGDIVPERSEWQTGDGL